MIKEQFIAQTENENDSISRRNVVTDKVEQFYREPQTQEELVENMRLLKEIPDSTSDPKVVIKLGDPHANHKFVHMKDEDGKQYVIALPIDKKPMHAQIANFARKIYKKDFQVIGGGYIHTEGDKLIVDGTSGSYGEAPKEAVGKILQETFPDLTIESVSILEDEAKRREDRYTQFLNSLETTVQRELYADVFDQQAIKMGYDYTSKPKSISNNEDYAYMIYSSENGGSFGFDTLYLGHKNKRGDIQSTGILRERWDIHVNNVKIEDDTITMSYLTNNQEKTISVPIGDIDTTEMTSSLSEVEKKLENIYKDNKEVFKDTDVVHGLRG